MDMTDDNDSSYRTMLLLHKTTTTTTRIKVIMNVLVDGKSFVEVLIEIR